MKLEVTPSSIWSITAIVCCVALCLGALPAQAEEEAPRRVGHDPIDPPEDWYLDEDGEPRFLPAGFLLTWRQDPTTTMTIDWQTLPDEERDTVIMYREKGSETFLEEEGKTIEWPDSDRTIHRVELTGLEPATKYEFRFGPDSVAYYFRTMPATADRPIRFAVGGDMSPGWRNLLYFANRQAVRYDVEFALIGGDFAYADGDPERLERWYDFFEINRETLVTPTHRVIPIVGAIGNHEVRGGYYHRDDHRRREGIPDYEQTDEIRAMIAPYFFALFAFPGQPGYNVLDFGEYMSIIALDTDHANPIDGEQTAWLESVLAERTDIPHVFPIYHVPGYPSHRDFDRETEGRVREHWAPLFDEYGVRIAFENHDHTYKRTYPIRNNEVHPNGVVYVGDGNWGVSGHREVHPVEDTWYLKQASPANHFIVVTIHGTARHLLMVNLYGDVIDEYPKSPSLSGGPYVPTPGVGERR